MSTVQVAVVSTRLTCAVVRTTVAAAVRALPDALVHVLDVDGSYRPVGAEHVLTPDDAGLTPPRLHRLAVVCEPSALEWALYPELLRTVVAGVRAAAGTATGTGTGTGTEVTLLAVRPGVLLLAAPTAMVDLARTSGTCVVARTPAPLPDDGRWPGEEDLVREGCHATGLVALHGPPDDVLTGWSASALATAGEPRRAALGLPEDAVAVVTDPTALLTAWNLPEGATIAATPTGGLRLDGRDVVAVDLSRLDPEHPWLLDADGGDPRARLSAHPVLAALVARYGSEVVADAASEHADAPHWDLTTTSLGVAVDLPLREVFRSLAPDAAVPDVFDPATADEFLAWLTEPAAHGTPGRYLTGIRHGRPDLRGGFPAVPGADTAAFVDWVRRYAVGEGYPAELVEPALAGLARRRRSLRPRRPAWSMHRPFGARPAPGVNVVGFLRGDFGLGESGRLMVSALRAADVPHTTVAVDQKTLGGRPADDRDRESFDTSLLCVNSDLTPAVIASLPRAPRGIHRIGMWYWEVEDFPIEQHGSFTFVDEIWTATRFIRDAIAAHSPVPVHVVAPPLPQRGGPPSVTPAQLGLPDRPYFLFSFDYASTAERKNPMGLVEAFRSAFAPGDGPVLVIKSINAKGRPAEAERLRLRVAAEPDVILMEDFLDPAARDALVASCACYVSLHRSEGLGLTMAEAMAWGKPVIATAYSGNLDFMTDGNSFLVPWSPTTIGPDAIPYPPEGTWADPDLAVAARFMRTVVDEPDVAAARGARAAADIATLHSPEVAGRGLADRLARSRGARGR